MNGRPGICSQWLVMSTTEQVLTLEWILTLEWMPRSQLPSTACYVNLERTCRNGQMFQITDPQQQIACDLQLYFELRDYISRCISGCFVILNTLKEDGVFDGPSKRRKLESKRAGTSLDRCSPYRPAGTHSHSHVVIGKWDVFIVDEHRRFPSVSEPGTWILCVGGCAAAETMSLYQICRPIEKPFEHLLPGAPDSPL